MSDSQPHIPPCTIHDLTTELVEFVAPMVAYHLCGLAAAPEQQITCTASLHRLLACPSAQCVLAAQDQRWVGFAVINWGFSTRSGYPILRIQDLFVLPAYRRQGIALHLLHHLIHLGEVAGARRLQLETGTDNHPAHRLYTAAGFARIPEKEIFMRFLNQSSHPEHPAIEHAS